MPNIRISTSVPPTLRFYGVLNQRIWNGRDQVLLNLVPVWVDVSKIDADGADVDTFSEYPHSVYRCGTSSSPRAKSAGLGHSAPERSHFDFSSDEEVSGGPEAKWIVTDSPDEIDMTGELKVAEQVTLYKVQKKVDRKDLPST